MLRASAAPEHARELFLSTKITYEEFSKCITQFYATPENILIAVPHVASVCRMKFHGVSPEEVEAATVDLRKLAIEAR